MCISVCGFRECLCRQANSGGKVLSFTGGRRGCFAAIGGRAEPVVAGGKQRLLGTDWPSMMAVAREPWCLPLPNCYKASRVEGSPAWFLIAEKSKWVVCPNGTALGKPSGTPETLLHL